MTKEMLHTFEMRQCEGVFMCLPRLSPPVMIFCKGRESNHIRRALNSTQSISDIQDVHLRLDFSIFSYFNGSCCAVDVFILLFILGGIGAL